jgi:hypothetical protein
VLERHLRSGRVQLYLREPPDERSTAYPVGLCREELRENGYLRPEQPVLTRADATAVLHEGERRANLSVFRCQSFSD